MSQSSNHFEHDSEFIVHKWLPSHEISIQPLSDVAARGNHDSVSTVWYHHVQMDQNVWKIFPDFQNISRTLMCSGMKNSSEGRRGKCMCFRQCTHLFSALVRLPVHSLTSRGHSQGHSHSFCSILNSKQLNSRSVRNLYSQFDSN